MGENSKIEWTTHTFNGWLGCQKVSPGCDHCYAEALMDKRWGKVQWGPHGERKRTSDANWRLPLRWAAQARRCNRCHRPMKGTTAHDGACACGGLIETTRSRVFSASLSDWLDNQVPQQWRIDLAMLIHQTPELDWLLLTKRIENFQRLSPWPVALPEGGQAPFPTNVWLGVTAEDQEFYDKRWAILSRIPAAVRFISYEPAIGPLYRIESQEGVVPDWLICGGESGAGYRYMNPEWAIGASYICQRARVPFFMKQMSGKRPIPRDMHVRQFPTPRYS